MPFSSAGSRQSLDSGREREREEEPRKMQSEQVLRVRFLFPSVSSWNNFQGISKHFMTKGRRIPRDTFFNDDLVNGEPERVLEATVTFFYPHCPLSLAICSFDPVGRFFGTPFSGLFLSSPSHFCKLTHWKEWLLLPCSPSVFPISDPSSKTRQ